MSWLKVIYIEQSLISIEFLKLFRFSARIHHDSAPGLTFLVQVWKFAIALNTLYLETS